MKKVSSAPDLHILKTNPALLPNININVALSQPHLKSFVGATIKSVTGPAPASSPTARVRAFDLLHQPEAMPNSNIHQDQEIAFAVASKGIISATECMASIEMEQAPSLVGGNAQAQLEAAMCLSTPVIPEQSNGELVQQKAARLANHAEAQLRIRYVQEISGAAVRSSFPARLRSRLARKRSLDDLDLHDALTYAESIISTESDADTDILDGMKAMRTSNNNNNNGPQIAPVTTILISQDVDDRRNRLELDAPLAHLKPDESISLEEPDHTYLIGGGSSCDGDSKNTKNEDAFVLEDHTNVDVDEKKEIKEEIRRRGSNIVPFRRVRAVDTKITAP